ncbi:hypothetical protein D3C81_1271490 [compost metagenome]
MRHLGNEVTNVHFAQHRCLSQHFMALDADPSGQYDQHAEAAAARLEQRRAIGKVMARAIALQALQFERIEDGRNLVAAAVQVERGELDGIVLRRFGNEFGCAAGHGESVRRLNKQITKITNSDESSACGARLPQYPLCTPGNGSAAGAMRPVAAQPDA